MMGVEEVVKELVSRLLILATHHLVVMGVKVVQVTGVLVVRMLVNRLLATRRANIFLGAYYAASLSTTMALQLTASTSHQ